MIDFEFISSPNGASDLEVLECCGTTCNKNRAILQMMELKDHVADLTAKVALLVLYTRFQAAELGDAPMIRDTDTHEMLHVLKNDAGLDYLPDHQLGYYIDHFRSMYDGVKNAH